MDSQKLGKRIREIRLAKKMTQSEVVGDFITRNMLSQIESGAATPSMRTLEYIAKVLEVSLNDLMPNEEADTLEILRQTKELLKQGEYKDVISMTSQLPPMLGDEASAISAKAHLALAKVYFKNCEYESANVHAKLAAQNAQKGVYASKEVRTDALVLIDEISKNQGSILEQI
ncbi:MAG: helix-turn-helix protein [Oscillospiraceae bacterium]|jgi:transcriptional regulator with XRE-family HTH domain|nr:helix-turn-helix protein [Oscillospiraceae bacterium]